LLGLLDVLFEDDAPAEAPVAAARDVGERPSAEEEPLNAIVRRLRVRAHDPGTELAGLRVAIKDSMAIAGLPPPDNGRWPAKRRTSR
jgi:amidase